MIMFTIRLGSIAKAIVSAVVAGVGAFAIATDDGNMSTSDIVTTALAILGALGVTYAVPNAPKE